jgi:AcrR family transcriptional regulator
MTDDRPWHTRPVVTGGSCSPFGGLRERKKAHTRELIIDAAIDLFERNGFDATTVEEIAAAADISPRTFFRYFESKIDVVMAEKGEDHQDIETLLAARPANENPIEAMRQVIRTELGRSLADETSLTARQYRVVMTTPSLRALAFDHFHEHQDAIARAFAARLGVDAASLKMQVLAATVASTTWTVLDWWVADGAAPGRLLAMIDEGFASLEASAAPTPV